MRHFCFSYASTEPQKFGTFFFFCHHSSSSELHIGASYDNHTTTNHNTCSFSCFVVVFLSMWCCFSVVVLLLYRCCCPFGCCGCGFGVVVAFVVVVSSLDLHIGASYDNHTTTNHNTCSFSCFVVVFLSLWCCFIVVVLLLYRCCCPFGC